MITVSLSRLFDKDLNNAESVLSQTYTFIFALLSTDINSYNKELNLCDKNETGRKYMLFPCSQIHQTPKTITLITKRCPLLFIIFMLLKA